MLKSTHPTIEIRKYKDTDFLPVAKLVRDVFTKFVIIPDATPEGVIWWTNYHNLEPEHIQEVRKRFAVCTIRYIAVENNEIIGTVMGTTRELIRIFVKTSHHGNGIGKKLFERFEKDCLKMGSGQYKITAALYAVPFYQKMGCKKSTGIRNFHNLRVQPMKRDI